MEDIQKDVEFRIMPSGDGGWYCGGLGNIV